MKHRFTYGAKPPLHRRGARSPFNAEQRCNPNHRLARCESDFMRPHGLGTTDEKATISYRRLLRRAFRQIAFERRRAAEIVERQTRSTRPPSNVPPAPSVRAIGRAVEFLAGPPP